MRDLRSELDGCTRDRSSPPARAAHLVRQPRRRPSRHPRRARHPRRRKGGRRGDRLLRRKRSRETTTTRNENTSSYLRGLRVLRGFHLRLILRLSIRFKTTRNPRASVPARCDRRRSAPARAATSICVALLVVGCGRVLLRAQCDRPPRPTDTAFPFGNTGKDILRSSRAPTCHGLGRPRRAPERRRLRRPRSARLHRLQLRHAGAAGRLVRRRHEAGRSARSTGACRRSATRSRATRSSASSTHPRRSATTRVAARRAQPAARALHREGVSRKRSGADDRRSHAGTGAVEQRVRLRARFGARSQFEIAVPFDVQQTATRRAGARPRRRRGRVQARRSTTASTRHASSAPAAKSCCRPARRSAGSATASRSSSRSSLFGQILPRDSFLQAQAGVEAPVDRERGEQRSVLAHGARATRFAQDRGFGRAWSPMVELLRRASSSGEPLEWDVVPQLQVTLSTRQHILVSGGVRIPLNERGRRGSPQVLTYLLWDWFDGGFFESGSDDACVSRRVLYCWLRRAGSSLAAAARAQPPCRRRRARPPRHRPRCSRPSDNCMACHNGLTTPTGEDVSIGVDVARDDDGQLVARSRTGRRRSAARSIDHPTRAAEIEDECAACHMPMLQRTARSRGRARARSSRTCRSAARRRATQRAGRRRRVVHGVPPDHGRAARHARELQRRLRDARRRPRRRTRRCSARSRSTPGRTTHHASSTGFVPAEAAHIRQSELCATCHTLYTKALGPDGAGRSASCPSR